MLCKLLWHIQMNTIFFLNSRTLTSKSDKKHKRKLYPIVTYEYHNNKEMIQNSKKQNIYVNNHQLENRAEGKIPSVIATEDQIHKIKPGNVDREEKNKTKTENIIRLHQKTCR